MLYTLGENILMDETGGVLKPLPFMSFSYKYGITRGGMGEVAHWADLGHPFKFSQLVANSQPTETGDGITFDGNDDFLTSGSGGFNLNTDWSLIMKLKLNSMYPFPIQGVFGNLEPNTNNAGVLVSTRHDVNVGDLYFSIERDDVVGRFTLSDNVATDTEIEVLLMKHKKVLYLIVDGVLKAKHGNGAMDLKDCTKYVSQIGKDRLTNDRYFSGSIYNIDLISGSVFSLTNLGEVDSSTGVGDTVYTGTLIEP